MHPPHDAPRRSADEQARVERNLADSFTRRIPFNEVVGLQVDSMEPGKPRMRFAMRPDLVGNVLQGRLHGGVIATAIDVIGGLALLTAIAEKYAHEPCEQVVQRFNKIGTIDLRVDYLRPGVGHEFVVHSEVTRLGGRIGSTQMRLYNEQERLLATGSGTYVIG